MLFHLLEQLQEYEGITTLLGKISIVSKCVLKLMPKEAYFSVTKYGEKGAMLMFRCNHSILRKKRPLAMSHDEITCSSISVDGLHFQARRVIIRGVCLSHNFSHFKDLNPDAKVPGKYKGIGGQHQFESIMTRKHPPQCYKVARKQPFVVAKPSLEVYQIFFFKKRVTPRKTIKLIS